MDERVIEQVIVATGLPTHLVREQVHQWALERGKNPHKLKIEDLREILIYLVQELFCDVEQGNNPYIKKAS